jgi:D-alanyl-D-alanine dipeptidase
MFSKKQRQISLATLLVLLVFCLAFPLAAYGAPAEPAKDSAGLLGLYQNDSGRFLIRERDGNLEMLYDVNPGKDEIVQDYAVYPLRQTAGDGYRWIGNGPLANQLALARFQRDAAGRGIACVIADKVFSRRFYGPDKGETFKIVPLLTVGELKTIAVQSTPPVENGVFSKSDLVEVQLLEPSIHLDIRYATTDNFMGVALYEQPRAFLQRPAAEALVRAHRTLAQYGYGILIHDAYRPWTVTKMFWEATPVHQRGFVADPAKGSRHNRGGAVDVGLYDLATGAPVNMVSGYDEFSPRAFPDFPGGTTRQRWDRELLRIVMEGENFTVYPEEWWHFDYKGWERFRIMNVSFAEIR